MAQGNNFLKAPPIYRVTVRTRPVVHLNMARSVVIEETHDTFFTTRSAAEDYATDIDLKYDWTSEITTVTLFGDTSDDIGMAIESFGHALDHIMLVTASAYVKNAVA